MKNLSEIWQLKTEQLRQEPQTQASPTDHKRREERISGIEDTIQEMDTSGPENV